MSSTRRTNLLVLAAALAGGTLSTATAGSAEDWARMRSIVPAATSASSPTSRSGRWPAGRSGLEIGCLDQEVHRHRRNPEAEARFDTRAKMLWAKPTSTSPPT
ncbi:MAG: hypothetical protein Ct9H300mP1_11290 [Planctomycetaceae bacterium]|nr:MAG: hypothetical protein Ct9H300mP1_11290 [Planctomycetaceae bacterium]